MYKVTTQPEAELAVEDIADRLTGISHASDIDKVIARITEAITGLADLPTRHRLLHPPIKKLVVRCVDAGKYTVYFAVDEGAEVVTVLDVQHRRRSRAALRRRLS